MKRPAAMSNLQIIERLCRLLDEAQQIIRDQAALMAAHDIETESGALEEQRARLLADIEKNT